MDSEGGSMMKSIRITIEWDGAADEAHYANVIGRAIVASDRLQLTRVSEVECLTDYGETEPVETPGIPRPKTFWKAFCDACPGPPWETGFR